MWMVANIVPHEMSAQPTHEYGQSLPYVVGMQPRDFEVVDLDNDGDNDVLAIAEGDNSIAVLHNQGSGRLSVVRTRGHDCAVPQASAQSGSGSFLCAQAAADVKRNDQLLADHNDEVCTEVTAGYDPNDIQVWPRGEGAEGRISTDVRTLSYMIRFQNTGNDTTFNVTVRDTLPSGLDVRRLRFGASSHNYKVSLLDNNILELYFEDIMLPDSTTDQLGSQGFVKYRVDLVENLAIGSSVKNRAAIYFDYNDAVLTNKAVSTIGGGSTSVGGDALNGKLSSAPNPVDGEVTISDIHAGVESLVLSDIGGRVLMRIPTRGLGKVTFNTAALAPGAYIVRTQGDGEVREVQIAVVR